LIGIVYKFTLPNDKVYIGETIQKLGSRVSKHKSNSRVLNTPLYNDINKFGWDNVDIRVLFQTKDLDSIYKEKIKYIIRRIETAYIEYYHSDNEHFGYNETKCKESESGYHLSEEHRNRIAETKQTINNKGKHIHTEEHKQYLRENIYNSKLLSEEAKAKAKQINIERCSKKCYQYSLDNIFIKEYPSIAEATRQTGISNIQAVCKGRRTKAGGYKWSYEKLN
jgi:group I intron endonuclease